MRIKVEEEIDSLIGTTFELHIYDLSPQEYDSLREGLNKWLREKLLAGDLNGMNNQKMSGNYDQPYY